MIKYYGENKEKKFFQQWYFKHQSINDEGIAFIPGISISKKGEKKAFIQVLTKRKSYYVQYSMEQVKIDEGSIQIGENKFSMSGIEININNCDLKVSGNIKYSTLVKLKNDMVRPLGKLKFAEYERKILSLRHYLSGSITIDNEEINFTNGVGYIETNWGKSLPEKYLWIQCGDKYNYSIMVSLAKVKFMGIRYLACIGIIYCNGEEYRLASYNRTKIICCESDKIILKRGKYYLDVDIHSDTSQKLLSPINGEMSGEMKEELLTTATLLFKKGKKSIFNYTTEKCSYGYNL